jgi:hypothetical protein
MQAGNCFERDNSKIANVVRKMANACVVPPLQRRVRQESADTSTKTFMAGTYAKITERGSGQYQRFVSAAGGTTNFLLTTMRSFIILKITARCL